MLAAFALVVGMSGAPMACDDDIYANDEPTVLACNTANCATDEQHATTPPQTTGCGNTNCAVPEPTARAPNAVACGSGQCATEEPATTTLPQGTAKPAPNAVADCTSGGCATEEPLTTQMANPSDRMRNLANDVAHALAPVRKEPDTAIDSVIAPPSSARRTATRLRQWLITAPEPTKTTPEPDLLRATEGDHD